MDLLGASGDSTSIPPEITGPKKNRFPDLRGKYPSVFHSLIIYIYVPSMLYLCHDCQWPSVLH